MLRIQSDTSRLAFFVCINQFICFAVNAHILYNFTVNTRHILFQIFVFDCLNIVFVRHRIRYRIADKITLCHIRYVLCVITHYAVVCHVFAPFSAT